MKMNAAAFPLGHLLSRPAGSLSSILNGGEGWGKEASRLTGGKTPMGALCRAGARRFRWFRWILLLVFGFTSLFSHHATANTADSKPLPSERYVWSNVKIGGGGFVTGIVFHPREKNLIYARTDVGGAYRWDAAVQRWIPITDWIDRANNNFSGI